MIHFIQESYITGDWSLDITVQEKSTGDVFFIQEFEYALYYTLLEYRKIGGEVEDNLIYRKETQRVLDEEEKDYLSRLIDNVLYSKIRQHYNTCKIESLNGLDNVLFNEGIRNKIKQKIKQNLREIKINNLL